MFKQSPEERSMVSIQNDTNPLRIFYILSNIFLQDLEILTYFRNFQLNMIFSSTFQVLISLLVLKPQCQTSRTMHSHEFKKSQSYSQYSFSFCYLHSY